MNKAQCSTFTAAGASGLAGVRECFHLPDFNKAGRHWENPFWREACVPLLCSYSPRHNLSWEVPRNSESAGRDTIHCGCTDPRAAALPGTLSYTHMTDTPVDTKLHMAFTLVITALAPWKGLTALRALAEASRALCYLRGCILVSIDPRDSPRPSMP